MRELRSELKTLRETKSLFLLYSMSNLAMILPKRLFQSPEQMKQWRQLVLAAIAPKKIEKPGLIGRWC
ncbi:MAG: YcxB family protein [Bryobacteraceae bacterium]